MADVKWIKIVTDVFDDEKIRLIEKMPEADSLIVIWFKLLCLAGKTNRSGLLMLNDKLYYTDEMLSSLFNRSLTIIRMALEVFERFQMIEIINNSYYISNWEKHQNIETLDKVREQTKIRVNRHRQKLIDSNATCNVTVTECNATELELDKKENKNKKENKKEIKNIYAEFVKMTEEEYQKLITLYGQAFTDECINTLDNYKGASNKKYASDYRAILNWVVDRVKEKKPKQQSNNIFMEIGKEEGLI